jgi:hypothetical protein
MLAKLLSQDVPTACLCACLCVLSLQLLAQVSYLKAISASYQPTHVLQPTTGKVWCHGGAHKSIRDVLDGCAAGVSTLLGGYVTALPAALCQIRCLTRA